MIKSHRTLSRSQNLHCADLIQAMGSPLHYRHYINSHTYLNQYTTLKPSDMILSTGRLFDPNPQSFGSGLCLNASCMTLLIVSLTYSQVPVNCSHLSTLYQCPDKFHIFAILLDFTHQHAFSEETKLANLRTLRLLHHHHQ